MGRIRYLKSEFFKDEDIAELSFAARLLYQGLWTIADREGRLEDRVKRIKTEVFPNDKVDVENLLGILSQKKTNSIRPFIIRYSVDREKYIQIVRWDEHQMIHHTERQSKIPPPPGPPTPKGKGKGKGISSSIKGKGKGKGNEKGTSRR